jgi:hypothetical protein
MVQSMEKAFHKTEDVKIYGKGSLGGKGAGLVRINECNIPLTRKLKTRILTTIFFDNFRKKGGKFDAGELNILDAILKEMGDVPVGVRSSATNEACVSPKMIGPVHAGENISFMIPNDHPDVRVRFHQLKIAIYHIYNDFIKKQPGNSIEKMAIVINPIPGIFDDTLAGPFYYPYISGVANSFFPYALKTQDTNEGFARIAFGHGYATVLDEFPVISMATIKNPIPLRFLRIGRGQQYFYALDMTKNKGLSGEELETMKTLHVRFANYHKIKKLGVKHDLITIEELVQNNHFSFKSGLNKIMETISEKICSHFQIEFVFNIDFEKKDREVGYFHIVQLTQLPELKLETIQIPEKVKHTYLSINSLQGHGIKRGIRHAVVVSPFIYKKDMHDEVRKKISEINHTMHDKNENYIILVPGRLGSANRDWGIMVNYSDVDSAAAIFEYGVDIAGRAELLPEDESVSGGIYGSHFLYMIQGGYDEDQKRLQTRIYGTQGTHFLTNLVSNNVIYGYIAPAEDKIDPWFFALPDKSDALYVLTFPEAVTIYADSINQNCTVVA